jgi:hypothetical protein
MTMSELIRVLYSVLYMLQHSMKGYMIFILIRTLNFFRRIIWLGDLNYRLNLSYERTHELISKQDWDGLFEKDQVI